jgi:hypothetical protein
MEQTTKKQWTKPELIVLVRSNPEEAVLGACKGGDWGGPLNEYALCGYMNLFCGVCEVVSLS